MALSHMQCKKAENLLDLYLIDDPLLSIEDKHWLKEHLEECIQCKQEYDQSLQAIALIRRHWQISEDTQALIDKTDQREQQQAQEAAITIKFPQFAIRIASIAALVIICTGIGYLFWTNINTNIERVAKPRPNQIQEINPGVTIIENGVVVSASDPIRTGPQMRELLINNKHRLIINRGTTISVNPLIKDEKLGCLINLHSGQILAEVEHDDNLFEVHTPHGKTVITGTIFDISVTDIETALVVAEGSVRFESALGNVDVMTGHRSTLRAKSKPSEPLACNTKALIAWASEKNTTIGIKKLPVDLEFTRLIEEFPLYLSYPIRSIALETLVYNEFVESKREWFKGQFPWIFKLQKVLSDKGIDVDYPELLIKTGDIWQIVYPERLYRVIPVIDPNSLLAVAKEYDLDKKAFSQVIESASQYQLQKHEMTFGVFALERLLAECRKVQDGCVIEKDIEFLREYSQAIWEYLENTRALIWLSIQNHILCVPDEHRIEVLNLLCQQIAAAYSCGEYEWHLSLRGAATTKANEQDLQRLINIIILIMENDKSLRAKLQKGHFDSGVDLNRTIGNE